MAGQAIRTQLGRAAAPIWQAIYRHPFVVEVGRRLRRRIPWDQAYRLAEWPA